MYVCFPVYLHYLFFIIHYFVERIYIAKVWYIQRKILISEYILIDRIENLKHIFHLQPRRNLILGKVIQLTFFQKRMALKLTKTHFYQSVKINHYQSVPKEAIHGYHKRLHQQRCMSQGSPITCSTTANTATNSSGKFFLFILNKCTL